MNSHYDIIIPTVELREKLTRCLQSIELLNNVNIIVVDDGSSWDISTLKNDFELIIVLQPIAGFGNKKLTLI